jgi:hypothetical protein
LDYIILEVNKHGLTIDCKNNADYLDY